MKVLLIDDERHARSVLKKMVDWSAAGVATLLEASDGEEAIAVIERERPQIILTDMRMPGKDGVSLLEWLDTCPYPHKTIVISAYSEYHYMQQTIRYGGFDYLVKPVDPEEVAERVRKAAEEWREEERERLESIENRIRVNEVTPLYWAHAFAQYAKQPDNGSVLLTRLQSEFGFVPGQTRGRVGLIAFEPAAERVREKFRDRVDLLRFAVENIVNEMIGFPEKGLAFAMLGEEGFVQILMKDTGIESLWLGKIGAAVRRILGVESEIILGEEGPFPGFLQEIGSPLIDIYMHRNLLKPRTEYVYTRADMEEMKGRPLTEGGDLKAAVLGGNEYAIRQHIDSLMSSLEQGGGTLQRKQIAIWEKELDLLREQLSEQEAESTRPLVYWAEDGRFSLPRLRADLLNRLLELAGRVSAERESGYKVIKQVREYIDEHYGTPVTLQELASKFRLHPDLLARHFKRETGHNLKDYLTRLRMDKAKTLLSGHTLRVHEVAEAVGFADEKYFSKAFKKHVGLTPSEYRKRRGNGG